MYLASICQSIHVLRLTSNRLSYANTDGVSNFVIGSVAHKTFFGKGGFTCDPKEPIPDWVHQHFVDFMTMVRKHSYIV
jgi:hypothetical protein